MQQVSFPNLVGPEIQRPEMVLSRYVEFSMEKISPIAYLVAFGHTTLQLLMPEEEEDTTNWDCHIQW